jgi:hypothetical protein
MPRWIERRDRASENGTKGAMFLAGYEGKIAYPWYMVFKKAS